MKHVLTASLMALAMASAAYAQPKINIRGIPYDDHSAGASVNPTSVNRGGTFTINNRTLRFARGQDIRVILQDTGRGNGFGVTALRLTSVRFSGTTLTVRAPDHAIYAGRTYHVTVFVYQRGQANKYISAGTLTVR